MALDQTPKNFRGLGVPVVNAPTHLHLQPLPPLEPGHYLTSSPTLPPAHYVTTTVSPFVQQGVDYSSGT